MSSQISSVYGRFVLLLLIANGDSFFFKDTLGCIFAKTLSKRSLCYTSFLRRGQKQLCISVTAEWSRRNDCRKCFWWISFARLLSDSVLVLAWTSMREWQVQRNDKHSIDCPPHGTSLLGLDDAAPLPTPVTSFYRTQRQWPVWLGSSTCSLSIYWVNEMEK